MNRLTLFLLPIALAANGCRGPSALTSRSTQSASSVAVETPAKKPAASDLTVSPAAFELPLLQPESGTTPLRFPSNSEPLPTAASTADAALSLQSLEQLALANNPALGQAEARVRALQGRWTQVGLPSNPTIGYLAEEMGDAGTAGKQGGFVGQDFVTGGKLGLNRAVVAQELERAQQDRAATELRVLTDVRVAYYAALLAQRRTDLAAELSRVSTQAADASRELFQVAGDIPRPALLQTQIEQQTAAIFVQNAENERLAARRQLSAVVGTDLTDAPLTGDVAQLPAVLNWEEQLARITAASPEMGAALADVARAQFALQRARVERIPDVSTQATVQHDNASHDTVAGVQVGLPLPVWNRNQGGIRQAEADVTEARRNADRVQLNLKRRLAIAFQAYMTARSQAEIYSTEILPKARETFELVQRGYGLGELGYLDYLSAQRTYSQTNLAYLDALSALWANWNEIEGLLLSGSLNSGESQR